MFYKIYHKTFNILNTFSILYYIKHSMVAYQKGIQSPVPWGSIYQLLGNTTSDSVTTILNHLKNIKH